MGRLKSCIGLNSPEQPPLGPELIWFHQRFDFDTPALLLFDLVDDFVVFRLFVEEILDLRLPIELDQDIAALDAASRGNQFRDSERAGLLS